MGLNRCDCLLCCWTFCQAQPCIKMIQTKTEAIDYPYPTTNTPSLTIHHTLIVCEAVRRVCPWYDERDAHENDWSDVSNQFSRKQLRNAMILVLRRQKPSTNALDGLDCMLEARWVEGCVVSLLRRTFF